MNTSINRRKWLKSGALLASGLVAAPWKWATAASRPAATTAELPSQYLNRTLRERPELQARLLANENPFGPAPSAKKAFAAAVDDGFKYAFAEKRQLQEAIAAKEGVTPDHIMLGAGSTELLMAAALYYGLKEGHILSADPSYTSLMRMADRIGSEWVKVPLTSDYKHDLNAMDTRTVGATKLVYICNPNNPTGTTLDPAKLEDFCKSVSKKAPIFIDEAYIDYVANPDVTSMIKCVRDGHNVMIARTFSKVHAFAGLRAGYLIAQPEVIKELDAFSTGGGTLSGPTALAALASYQDADFIKYSVKMNKESKDFVYKTLKAMDYEYVPSDTNFVLFPLRMHGDQFRNAMMDKGVGIRTWEFNRQHWCRVSMGKMDDMKLFAQAFNQVVS
ncbi:histidinol-phosphate aminotransferase [Catalinimonas alkaloidigena]|uniref:Histidinol-phosphate aminotransferase n=1 Tax=Catalinimonas alkaloidigena TaxID=1075417 RepID=A0A1G9R2E4_9BACT|nr:histidinol-phosphate transaminase [Catalinimonas alkaloidigena]SDM17414.1 histidinol-phosphate aminotransferase [Catalinimonas alkaloidigena]